MTYTVIAQCPDTGRLGCGIATYSLGVGGYCPFFARGKAVLSTQAFANPALGPLAVQALEAGEDVPATLKLLAEADPGYAYRQIGIVDSSGAVAMHTGASTRSWAGHHIGKGFAAFGNVLAGAHVVDALAAAFEASAGRSLDQRLLASLEAGRDAGGQASGDGAHLPERSAALTVQGGDIVEDINLRVDLDDDAVTALRRVHAGYAPYLAYYTLRARNPEATPAQDVWAREHLTETQDNH